MVKTDKSKFDINKSNRKRSASSSRWLIRQSKDPYVLRAKREGFRSRAAYKLLELNNQFNLISHGDTVVDFGAAPGGWSQVAANIVGDSGKVIGVDVITFEKLAGVESLIVDLNDPKALQTIKSSVPDKASIVLSDMAPKATGHRSTDNIRGAHLAEIALELALELLRPGGNFVVKIMRGGPEPALLQDLRKFFLSVEHAKPKASRKDSAELYLTARGFREL